MAVLSSDGKIPRIGEGSYVHASAGALGKAYVDLARRYPDELQNLE
jgi:hypothetical protein